MSTASATEQSAPHVLPISTYLKVWGSLIALTALTVGASYVSFGRWNLPIAMAIAATKAALVALVFMHLAFDRKFHAFVFVSSLIFLSLFISFTMFDTNGRGKAESIERERPADLEQPFGGTRYEADLKARYSGKPAAPEH